MTIKEAESLHSSGLFRHVKTDKLCQRDLPTLLEKLTPLNTDLKTALVRPALQKLIKQGITLPTKTMNELNDWLNDMEQVGGNKQFKGKELPENSSENAPQLSPQMLRQVQYSPPGRQPNLFEQARKQAEQQKESQQQAQQAFREGDFEYLNEIQQQQNQQQNHQHKPQEPMPQPQPQPAPSPKSPLEIQLEALLALEREQAAERQRQQQEAEQRREQEQEQAKVNPEQLDELTKRVEVLETTTQELQNQVGTVADQAGQLEGRVASIEANYVGSTTFEDAVNDLQSQLKQISQPKLVQIPGRPEVKLDKRTHQAFEEALLLAQVFKQAFFVGPAGTGKTSLSNDVAKAMSLNFGFISCTAGLAEAHLLGRMLADGSYVPARFVELYENGGVFLFDEVDAADANTLLVVNSALANGYLSVPNRRDNPVAHRHADFVCLVAANTLGTGSFEYHGRNYLDAAFLDRFALSRLRVDYDLDLEREMLSGDAEMARVLHKIRFNLEQSKTRRVLSTRAFVSTAQLLLVGKTPQQVIDKLMLGWTDEEKNRALKDVVVPKSSPLKALGEKQRETEKKQREQEAAKARKAEQDQKHARSLEKRNNNNQASGKVVQLLEVEPEMLAEVAA